jgi:predicted nucleic acid-binding protein
MVETSLMSGANILISSVYKPNTNPHRAYLKATYSPYSIVLCDQIIDEFRRFLSTKSPSEIAEMERFFVAAHYNLVTLDVTDRPILRAALKAEVDIFVTEDKDFLESTVTHPNILTAVQFLQFTLS